MKRLITFPFLVLLAILAGVTNSCEDPNMDSDLKGRLEIAFDLSDPTLKSVLEDSISPTANDSTPEAGNFHILISLETGEGVPVMEDELIPLYQFGQGFVSKRIELKTGNYRLTKFMVINPLGKVVFAAPLKGSPKSYLVLRPLPLMFRIIPDELTRIVPEVLSVNDQSPEDFGYAGFGFQVVKPLPFYILALVQHDDILLPPQPTEAMLIVRAPDGWEHTYKLEARVNRLVARGGSPEYLLIARKEGHDPVRLKLSARELLNSTRDNPVIIRFLKPGIKVLHLKPGPDDGKDAMISNLNPDRNFGSHRFFEATFISEPVLTVMRTNRSLIWFDIDELPRSAQIKKAVLSLYNVHITAWEPRDEDPVNQSDEARYGAVLQQIVEPWEEHKVTWNTQPKTIESNQVYIPMLRTSKRFDIDVSPLIGRAPVENYGNYGMLFRQYPSDHFPGFRFASSDYPDRTMHPELTIYYTLP